MKYSQIVALFGVMLLISACSISKPSFDLSPLPPKPAADVYIKKLWSSYLGQGTRYSNLSYYPASDDANIYNCSYYGVVALNKISGAVNWRYSSDEIISGCLELNQGRVFVGKANGELINLNADNGKEVWRSKVSSSILHPPRVSDDYVLLYSADSFLNLISNNQGAVLWSVEIPKEDLTLYGAASPIFYGDSALVANSAGGLYSLALTPTRINWQNQIATSNKEGDALDSVVDIDVSPLLIDDVVYVAGYQGNLAAINADSGNTIWSNEFSSNKQLVANGDYLFAIDDEDGVYAFNRFNGDLLWENKLYANRGLTSPTLQGDFLVFGDSQGYLSLLGQKDGKVITHKRISPYRITPIIFNDDGKLYALDAAGWQIALEIKEG